MPVSPSALSHADLPALWSHSSRPPQPQAIRAAHGAKGAKRPFFLPAAALFFILLFLAASALAQNPPPRNPLEIELVSRNTSIRPGTPFYVGLRLVHPPGYHTYWKFPGIVGIPTGITWQLPKGWKADPIQWPTPDRVLMFNIKAQGFEDEQLLPIRISPPKNLEPGKTVLLRGKARWMCCGKQCYPGFKDLELELPIRDSEPARDARWAKLFKASQEAAPKPSPDWSITATRANKEIVLQIKPKSAAAKAQVEKIAEVLFFTEDGLTDPNQPESLEKTETGLVLRQTLSQFAPSPLPKKVIGVLKTPQAWTSNGPVSIQLSVPLTLTHP